MILRASHRATELIREIAGGTPAKEIHVAGKLPADPANVSLSYEKCDRVIGVAIKPKTIDEILTHFGLKKTKSTSKGGTWKIPSYRRDLQRDVDLIEEVVRAYGIDKIPGTTRGRFMPISEADRSHDLETFFLRGRLAGCGLSEVRTSKLISRSASAFSEDAIELRNPLSEDHVALRPSLISGLLGVLERNIRAGAESVSIFEIGRVFPSSGKEERYLGILLWGNVASAPNWRSQTKRNLDLFDLKGTLECVVPNLSFRPGKFSDLAFAVEVWSGDQLIGFGGQLSATKSSAPGSVFVAELHADLLLATGEPAKKFRELDRFPSITRDIAMMVPDEISHEKILRTIEEPREPLLESVELFDLFTEQVGAARKSLAYRLTYRDRSRTLTNEEVTEVHAGIRGRLKRELGVTLRE
jgi:phenylalanyl-tRNA synthetase beta chain